MITVDSSLKTNTWRYKIKDMNGEKNRKLFI